MKHPVGVRRPESLPSGWEPGKRADPRPAGCGILVLTELRIGLGEETTDSITPQLQASPKTISSSTNWASTAPLAG